MIYEGDKDKQTLFDCAKSNADKHQINTHELLNPCLNAIIINGP